MQIVLLATGEESKLRPLTEQITAPMLPVLNQPVIGYHLEAAARQGYRQILVTLFHLSDMVEHYCGDGKRWHTELTYVLQRQALGTAGSIKRAERLLTDTFLVLPADALLDLDLDAAFAFHQSHGGVATVILSSKPATATPSQRTLQLDAAHRVIAPPVAFATQPARVIDAEPATSNKPVAEPVTGLVTGAYIFDRAVLELIPAGVAYDCLAQLLPALIAAGSAVYGYVNDGYWNALASFQEYHAAQETMLQQLSAEVVSSQGPFPTGHLSGEIRSLGPGIWSGVNSVIHPQAKLTPPLYIGTDCQIGAHSELGPNVMLGNHVFVDEGATIQQSTVLENSYVGRLVDIQQRVVHQDLLIDQRSNVWVQIPDRWLLGYVHPTLAPNLLRRLVEQAIALLLLLLFAPLLLILGLAVWLTSAGGVFVVAERVGVKPVTELGAAMPQPQALRLCHLRTRSIDGHPTLLGPWLERFAFHRLPELWSVLWGEIALVGVKPLLLEEAAKITEEWQRVRYQSPAGCTGLWYTQPRTSDSFEALCVVDSYQAVTGTWQQALYQLWLTPFVWLRNARRVQVAYGAVKASEVRSQAVIQRPPIGW